MKIVAMGVTGTGKSLIGARLADALDGAFTDGDDLHPPANVAKMAEGIALEDSDRWPWLDIVGQRLAAGTGPRVIACSALKRSYRDRIRRIAGPVLFLHLTGPRAVIADRMSKRTGHFMPVSLLDSQLATLEPPGPGERSITIDIARPPTALLVEIRTRLSALTRPKLS